MTDYKMVFVKWIDSTQVHGWILKEDLEEHDMNIVSCGFLICETDHFITLTGSVGKDCICSPIQIPKIAIISMEEINHGRINCCQAQR